MTIEMQHALERELQDAKTIENPERRHEAIEMVQSHMLAALIDCQRKTAERVKELIATAESARHKIAGAKILWAILRYVVSFGGGAALVKILSATT